MFLGIVPWINLVIAKLQIDYLDSATELNHRFHFLAVEETWLILAAIPHFVGLAIAYRIYSVHRRFTFVLAAVSLLGATLSAMVAFGLGRGLFWTATGVRLELLRYWTEGGGLFCLCLVAIAFGLVYGVLRGFEAMHKKAH